MATLETDLPEEAAPLTLRAPFPWFGGKRRVASLVWERFGNVPSYIEPFAGSLAVLLGRPHPPGLETVNDNDAYLSNFWRAVTADAAAVARWADHPVNETDLHARHLWLLNQTDFRERMMTDRHHFDAKIAGWWVWGLCNWIGDGWCDLNRARPPLQLPSLAAERGIMRREVQRTTRQIPHLSNSGQGLNSRAVRGGAGGVEAYLCALQARLRNVRVACGNWDRILGDSVLRCGSPTAIFLDPPYDEGEHTVRYSGGTGNVSADVRAWAIENGHRPELRIALCGYAGEHSMPEDWEEVPWKATGGYGVQGEGRGRENAARERIWFSPTCAGSAQASLF